MSEDECGESQLGNDKAPRFPRRNVRLISGITGRYTLSRRRLLTGRASAFACRAVSISPTELVIAGPVPALIGDKVTCYFQDLGILTGEVTRSVTNGFAMKLDASEEQRDKYAATITWLKRRQQQTVPDYRSSKRVLPRQPRSTLITADGHKIRCFVIDMSSSGAAVSADFNPHLGAALAVGSVVGRVVRHLEVGFAIQFRELQDLKDLEYLLIKPGLEESFERPRFRRQYAATARS